ncbi:MAG: hypothetical protein CMC73_07680 [Flavobacteriaceae bacterium]|mgnify:FL=1|jgi:hypothetical protein|nr:hypothetical protein [Flavobacteriaceae bacterium]|tara:strand:+ start:2329 stop:2607 length:279 start_codon:yes stop_codon:yes gene_type:complete
MLPKLQKHSKHIQEVKTLRDSAKKVKDQKIKADLNMLTDKLVELVDMIDVGHTTNPNGHITPALMQEPRTQMNIIRAQARKLLDDYNKSNNA